jgi:hypothetical protein
MTINCVSANNMNVYGSEEWINLHISMLTKVSTQIFIL